MTTKGQLLYLGFSQCAPFATPDPPDPPPEGDVVVTNYSELTAALATDLSNTTVLITGNCTGAEITLTNKTWPGAVFTGPSADAMPLMPRMTFINCHGAEDEYMKFKWLDFYAAATANSTGEGIITYENATRSSWMEFDSCKIHDDPFPQKDSWLLAPLEMWWGFGSIANGGCDNLWVHHCEIYNVIRSIFRGDDVLTEYNEWHDHFVHAMTITGKRQTHQYSYCYNLWANQYDYANPHAGLGISPSHPTGSGNVEDILVRGIVAIPGTARREWAEEEYPAGTSTPSWDGVTRAAELRWNPGASGFKFNDSSNQVPPRNYVNCIVEYCILVGTDVLMLEFDCGINCAGRFNTIVHDELMTAAQGGYFWATDSDNVTHSDSICYGIDYGALGMGDAAVINCLNAKPNITDVNSNLNYRNIFAGTNFSLFSTPQDAIDALALNPSHPASSWTTKPGAVDNFDFETWTPGPATPTPRPTISGVTTQTALTVTKPDTCYLITGTAAAGTGILLPANKRAFTFLTKRSVNSSIDNVTRYIASWSSSVIQIYRKSSDFLSLIIKDTNANNILVADSSITVASTDGIFLWGVSVDLDAAKCQMVIVKNGELYYDFPTITTFTKGVDIGYDDGRILRIGANSSGSAQWVGEEDTDFFEPQFLDLHSDAGISKFLNTSNGMRDLGAGGTNVFSSTAAIYVHANAASRNSSNVQTGDGTGSTGGTVAFTLTKSGANSYS